MQAEEVYLWNVFPAEGNTNAKSELLKKNFIYIFLVTTLVVSTEFHVYSQGISCKSRIGTTVVYIRVKFFF